MGSRRAPRNAKRQKNGHHAETGNGREIARGKGALEFFRMTAIDLDVEQVVDDVGRRSREAETEEMPAARSAGAWQRAVCASSRGRKMSRFFAH